MNSGNDPISLAFEGERVECLLSEAADDLGGFDAHQSPNGGRNRAAALAAWLICAGM
jgi:hypothetical protein